MVVKIKNLQKNYGKRKILDGINLEVKEGEKLVILGKSGSGKTTLLNIIATIDSEYSGEVELIGEDIKKLNNSQLAKIRRDKLGFIFQDFGLLENLTSEENILLPLKSAGLEIKKDEYYHNLIRVLDIGKFLSKYPSELSGGEKQRVAIARAIVKNPDIVIADEITSALDIATAHKLMTYLNQVITEFGMTLLMVTHDLKVADFCDSIYFIKNKKLVKVDGVEGAEFLFFDEEDL